MGKTADPYTGWKSHGRHGTFSGAPDRHRETRGRNAIGAMYAALAFSRRIESCFFLSFSYCTQRAASAIHFALELNAHPPTTTTHKNTLTELSVSVSVTATFRVRALLLALLLA